MKKNKLYFTLLVSLFFTFIPSLFAQAELPLSHKGLITDMAETKSHFFTSSVDGFIIRWDSFLNQEKLQVSDIAIQNIAVHPDGNLLAIYETDGLSVYRLSVWDWQKKERLYAKRLTEKITSLSFSQKGNYILIGNGNLDGLIILDAVYGLQVHALQNTIPQVALAQTSETESTLVSYSINGQIIYCSLDDGSRKAFIQTEKNLSQACFLDLNKRFFAGIKNKQLFIIDATNGKTLNKISINNASILSNYSNQEFYIIDETSKNNFNLKKISLEKSNSQFQILSEASFQTELGISKSLIVSNKIFLGTDEGSLYSLDKNTNESFFFVKKESESSKAVFLDIAKDGQNFFILTNEALYSISENEKELNFVCENQNWKNIIVDKNAVYFYSKGEREALVLFDLEMQSYKELFKPSLPLEIVKIFDTKIISLLSSTTVQTYDLLTGKNELLYSGTGLNDIAFNDTSLFISKSAATNPRTPLIEIDIDTKETVILPLDNDFIYALDQSNEENNPYIYGLSISSNANNFSTELFYYHKDRKTYTSILRLQDENINAFLSIQDSILYTNLGKTDIRMIDLKNYRTQVLAKTKVLPEKIKAIGKRTLILNQDGTITWYQSNKLLKEWNANIIDSLSL